jgi:hypothetical protein
VLVAHDLLRAREPGQASVFRRLDLFQAVELADGAEALVDELPGAGAILSDLAAIGGAATAGAVEHALGTAGDRADAAEAPGGSPFSAAGGDRHAQRVPSMLRPASSQDHAPFVSSTLGAEYAVVSFALDAGYGEGPGPSRLS